MQLTPETAAEIHRIFDDPEPDEPSQLDDERYADEMPYALRSPRMVEMRALLAWISSDDAFDDDDSYDRV